MEPNKIKQMIGSMFPASVDSFAADYAAFLSARVPKDLARQLDDDGQPDIGLIKEIDVSDLMRPLMAGVIPSDKRLRITSMLGYLVIGYGVGGDDEDPYKVIYVCSMYLYGFLQGGGTPEGSGYMTAVHMLTVASMKVDMQARMQVCRFVASLVPMIHSDSIAEDAPLSSFLLMLFILLGSLVEDVSLVAEEAMANEQIASMWIDAEIPPTQRQAISFLSRSASEMGGSAGRLVRSADRLLRMLEAHSG